MSFQHMNRSLCSYAYLAAGGGGKGLSARADEFWTGILMAVLLFSSS